MRFKDNLLLQQLKLKETVACLGTYFYIFRDPLEYNNDIKRTPYINPIKKKIKEDRKNRKQVKKALGIKNDRT